MKEPKRSSITCPFCEEGVLKNTKCPRCGRIFLMCDECESLYRDGKSLEEELPSTECPFCGTAID